MMAQEDKQVVQKGINVKQMVSDAKAVREALKGLVKEVKYVDVSFKEYSTDVGSAFSQVKGAVQKFSGTTKANIEGIQKKLSGLKTVGSALGGIGKSAASGLSKIFLNLPDLLSASLTTIDFSSLGRPFSSALGSMLGTIDLTTFTQGMAQKMVAAGTNIAPAMTQVGLGLATSFNQMLATLDFSALGTVLAQRLMALPLQLSAIVTALDWSALGLGIAAVLTTLLTSIDLSMIATTIANFLNGIATTIMTFVTTFDWAGLAANVFNGINSLFTGIDWGLLAATISQTAMTLLQTMIDIVMGIDWGSIGLAIWQFIANIDWLGLIGNILKLAFELLKATGETIMGVIGGIFSSLFNQVKGIIEELLSVAFRLAEDFLSGIEDVVLGVKKFFSGIIDFVAGVFTGNWKKAWDGIKNIFSGIWQALVGIVKAPLNAIIGLLNSVIEGINLLIKGANKVTGAFGVKISTIPKLPYLATGAVIPPNAPFLAVLGDQRRGNNIEAPEGLIRKIVREESGQGGARGGSYRFTAQINRRTLFEEFINEAKLRQMTTGRNPFELA